MPRKRVTANSVISEASDETPRLNNAITEAVQGMPSYDGLQELYIDRMLADSERADATGVQGPHLQGLGVFGSEYNLTFFSEARLSSLATQLGHNRVSDVRSKVSHIITERMRIIECVPAPAADSDRIHVFGMEEEAVAKYVHCKCVFIPH